MNNQNDKPLYYQEKWWFISDDKRYFYYIDLDGLHQAEFHPRDNFSFGYDWP